VLGASVIDGKVALGQAFFNPELITQYGIEPYLKGLAEQEIQEIDNMVVDGVRNLLFDPPTGVDLGAVNLQRGRDHGLPDYNQARMDFGLTPVGDFADISSDPDVAAAISAAYDGDVNNIDAWAAAISEDHLPGSSVGELVHTVLVDQFTRLRDGDRFYYEQVLRPWRRDKIQNTLLSDIIRRNTGLKTIQDEIFRSDDVFTYRARQGRGALNVTLRAKGRELQVVRVDDNRVIASQPIGRTDIVVLFGTSKDDIVRIDASVARSFRGSVEVHGGAGRDTLVVATGCRAKRVVVESSRISVKGLDIFYGNFEKVRVRPKWGWMSNWSARPMHVVMLAGGGQCREFRAAVDALLGGQRPDVPTAKNALKDGAAKPKAISHAWTARPWSGDRSHTFGRSPLFGSTDDERALDGLFATLDRERSLLDPFPSKLLD
jgi:hypothetical protein